MISANLGDYLSTFVIYFSILAWSKKCSVCDKTSLQKTRNRISYTQIYLTFEEIINRTPELTTYLFGPASTAYAYQVPPLKQLFYIVTPRPAFKLGRHVFLRSGV